MQVQKVNNQSFGMAVRYRPDYNTVRNFIYANYDKDVNEALGILTKFQQRNPFDIYLSNTKKKNGKEVLRAEVEYDTYTEGFWRSAKRVLSGAEKRANQLLKDKQELDRILNKC